MKNNLFKNAYSRLLQNSISTFKYRVLLTLSIVFISSALVISAWHLKEDRSAKIQIAAFGETMAAQIAELVLEPLVSEDRIRLHTLTNRMAEFEQIVGISISSVDNQLISAAGRSTNNPQLPTFTHRIVVQETIAGDVRVAVEPNAFRTAIKDKIQASIMWMFGAIFVAGLLEVFFQMTSIPTRNDLNKTPSQTEPIQEEYCYVLVVNVFNQIILSQDDRKNLLNHVMHSSGKVANLYAANVFNLAGTGILMAFEKTEDKERVFEIICATVLLRQILSISILDYPKINYRFGLHVAPNSHIADVSNSEYIADTIVLSALAQDGEISCSGEVGIELEGIESVARSEKTSLAVTALTTTPNYSIVYDISESYRNLIKQQAELIVSKA